MMSKKSHVIVENNYKTFVKEMNKDFGKRNVEGFKGLDRIPYKLSDKIIWNR